MIKKLLFILIIVILVSFVVTSCTSKAKKNRNYMQIEINNLKNHLFDYYRQPRHYGGGGKSWDSIKSICHWLNCSYPYKTNNGTYHFVINGDVLSIVGTGTVIGKDGSTNVRITVKITGVTKSITTTINN